MQMRSGVVRFAFMLDCVGVVTHSIEVEWCCGTSCGRGASLSRDAVTPGQPFSTWNFPFDTFIAIGDSQTEGLYDYHADGSLRGWMGGWADRSAERLSERNPDLVYANLAVRGKRTSAISESKIEPALALEPDRISMMSGVNDMVSRSTDPVAVAVNIERMSAALASPGQSGHKRRTAVGPLFPHAPGHQAH